jgi:hypothetical protein
MIRSSVAPMRNFPKVEPEADLVGLSSAFIYLTLSHGKTKGNEQHSR